PVTAPPPANEGAVRHELPPELLHELRTPLTQIIGYSEMLIEPTVEAGHAGYVTDLRKVNAAGYRLLALIEEHFESIRPPGPPPALPQGPVCVLDPKEGA
ncbi:MAG TPA: histidine kinase dimerization/phospho-acceptor domain-containing protein, partial [Longimicrobium sp.]|nr:histidine kinase dimerization/phospho-acceptor domain-containing protein [Longimicrobium sp.]